MEVAMLAPTAAYQPDVYITREGKNNVLHCDVQSKGQGEEKKLNRMNLMRNKFTECRKRKEQQEAKNITIVKTPKTWKGMKMKSAKVTSNADIQEEFVPIIIGADVIALMTEEEQRTSELRDILPRRTTKNGVSHQSLRTTRTGNSRTRSPRSTRRSLQQ